MCVYLVFCKTYMEQNVTHPLGVVWWLRRLPVQKNPPLGKWGKTDECTLVCKFRERVFKQIVESTSKTRVLGSQGSSVIKFLSLTELQINHRGSPLRRRPTAHIIQQPLLMNLFSSPPAELADLPLIRLDFSCNKITEIPAAYRKLRQLQHIILDNNPMQSPPAQVSACLSFC